MFLLLSPYSSPLALHKTKQETQKLAIVPILIYRKFGISKTNKAINASQRKKLKAGFRAAAGVKRGIGWDWLGLEAVSAY